MRPLPTAPSADDEISASFMRRLIECIKERTILNAPGYRTKSGPNGTTLEIEPGKRSSSPADVLPWTFSCSEEDDPDNPGEKKRTGGWKNCILQLGFNDFLHSEDVEHMPKQGGESLTWHPIIEGTDLTEDGVYFVEVDTVNRKAEIKRYEERPQKIYDFEHGIVNIWIGAVSDGKQWTGIHHHPFVPLYADEDV